MRYPSLVPATRIATAGAALAALLLLPAQAVARTDAVASVGGSIVEYALPSNGGNGFSVTSGPDGKVWFATGRDTAGRIDPNNPSDLVEYTLPSVGAPGGPQARGITTGSDGNLWVTEPDADRIAQVPTTGSPIQEFAPSPCGESFTFCISYIASDSAGNLWFTESTRDEIGRINPLDPTQPIVEFHTGCCFPIGMTTGPDGNVWFTLYGGGIGRVTPDGVITEFPIHGGGPQAITAGADGQLYFVEFLPPNGQDAIGRMDVDGNLTGDFPIHAGANPQTLTLGADGNIWIPELGLDSLGHLGPSGVYGEVPVPCPYSSPFGITSGPDGDIWFTDHQNGTDASGNPTSTPAIGRLDPLNLPVGRSCPTGALTLGFWQNKNGQAIISGANQSALSAWLKQLNPFSDAPSGGLAIYAYNIIKAASASGASMNAMLKAQMLATALDVYFSDPALGGNKINAPTPIGGVTIDLTKICETIDGSGCSGSFENVSSAFGGPASMTVMNMLLYQDTADPSADAAANWYGQVKATQVLAKDAFDAINNQVAFSL